MSRSSKKKHNCHTHITCRLKTEKNNGILLKDGVLMRVDERAIICVGIVIAQSGKQGVDDFKYSAQYYQRQEGAGN